MTSFWARAWRRFQSPSVLPLRVTTFILCVWLALYGGIGFCHPGFLRGLAYHYSCIVDRESIFSGNCWNQPLNVATKRHLSVLCNCSATLAFYLAYAVRQFCFGKRIWHQTRLRELRTAYKRRGRAPI